jgi:hypothetical protein
MAMIVVMVVALAVARIGLISVGLIWIVGVRRAIRVQIASARVPIAVAKAADRFYKACILVRVGQLV